MAFLDNSGDIILDAVLTDLGRKRLAAGNFRISKFALGDEEINYELFNSSDARGSAFYDLEIMQTPVLEAFTSDQSLMKTRLLTLTRNNFLYMPIFKINDKSGIACKPDSSLGGFNLISDEKTYTINSTPNLENAAAGFLRGVPNRQAQTTHICVDQGIDSGDNGMSLVDNLDPSLLETAFMVKVDHRLIRMEAMTSDQASSPLVPQVDDDAIATYYVVQGGNQDERTGITVENMAILGPRSPGFRSRSDLSNAGADLTEAGAEEMFAGALGNVLRITPRASIPVQQSTSLFDELGTVSADALPFRGSNIPANYKYIDTLINVTGVTTGYSIDIPIRIIKGIF